MSKSRTEWIGWSFAAGIFVLFAVTNLFHIEMLWGFNLAAYLPPIWLYFGLGLIVISFLPAAVDGVIAVGVRISNFIDRSTFNRRLSGAVAAIIFGVVFWVWSAGLPLLGDGSLRCREIVDGKLWQPTELLDFLLHALTFKFVTRPLHIEVTQAFRYISIVSGVVFLFGTYKLAAYLDRDRRLLWTIAAFGLGITVLFFGYVESYSIVAALIPWLILIGAKVADGRLAVKGYVLLVIVAGLFHSVMIVLFGASAVFLTVVKSAERRNWILKRRWLGPGLGLIFLVLLLIGKAANLPIFSTYVLPLLPSPSENVALLSLPHLTNLVNWTLLSGLAIIPFLTGLRAKRAQDDDSSRRLFVHSLVVPAILFILLFPPKLGGPIDWDLFSLPFATIAFGLMIVAGATVQREFPRWFMPILVVALVNTASFAAVNHSVTASAERFSRIIPLSSSPNPWIHWSSLVVHSEHQPDLYNRRNEFLLKSWQAPPNNKRDSVTTLTKLMRESVTANDSLSTRRIVEILNSIPGLPPEVLASETDAFVKFGSVEEQRAFAEMLADGFPSSPTALGAAGVLFMNLGELERCGAVLARSYELDSTNFRVALNYGVYLANRQDFYAATPVLRQALKLDGASFFAAYYLANSCLAVGDVAGAKEAMLHAEANALRPEEQERIKQLKMRF